MDRNDILRRIKEEEDYVRAPKFGNSLNRFLNIEKNSEGVENHVIARLLMISEEEVETLYDEAVALLREDMIDEKD